MFPSANSHGKDRRRPQSKRRGRRLLRRKESKNRRCSKSYLFIIIPRHQEKQHIHILPFVLGLVQRLCLRSPDLKGDVTVEGGRVAVNGGEEEEEFHVLADA